MRTEIETTTRAELVKVLGSGTPEELDLDASLAEDLGLTSLNKVMLLTSLCARTGVSPSVFTEADLAELRTLRAVVDAFARHSTAGSAR